MLSSLQGCHLPEASQGGVYLAPGLHSNAKASSQWWTYNQGSKVIPEQFPF